MKFIFASLTYDHVKQCLQTAIFDDKTAFV